MDPNACLDEIAFAIKAKRFKDATYLYNELQAWKNRGGFPPSHGPRTGLEEWMLTFNFRRGRLVGMDHTF